MKKFEDIYNKKMKLYEQEFNNSFTSQNQSTQTQPQPATDTTNQTAQPNQQQDGDEVDLIIKSALQMDPQKVQDLMDLSGDDLIKQLATRLQQNQQGV